MVAVPAATCMPPPLSSVLLFEKVTVGDVEYATSAFEQTTTV
jgi:hypothetical protein